MGPLTAIGFSCQLQRLAATVYDNPIIARARITSGNFEVAPSFSDMKDLVVMDDYVFGATVIPEPSTWFTLLAGLAGLAWLRRRSAV